MATGLGKTITSVELSRSFASTLFIVDSEELAEQASAAFRSIYPEVGLIKADVFDIKKVTIASAQTLHKRLHKLSADQFELQVVDEAHLYMAATFRKGVEFFTPKLRVGITATPERMDNLPLFDLFGNIIFEYGIREGIQDGYLVELDARRLKTKINLDSVGTIGGEFNQKQLSNEIDTLSRNNQIVDDYIANNKGERAIAFCCSIEHAMHLCEAFQMKGVKATAISSDEDLTGDRTQKVKDFREGKYDVICNVNILTKGFDAPEVSCIINAAPTKSRTKYLQCLDEKTEILTKNGWKNINSIKKSDKVAGYNINTYEITWENINKIYKRERGDNEDMYSVDLPGIDIRVTGGHRMIYSKKFGRKKTYLPYCFGTAEEYSKLRYTTKIPVSGIQQSNGLPLTKWELIFLGLFLSDGSINKRRNQVYISQSAHQIWNNDIIECLSNCGIKYRFWQKTRKTQFSDSSTMNYYYIGINEFKHLLPWLHKKLHKNYEKITPQQLEFLIHGINIGDGAKTKKIDWTRRTYNITTGSLDFANNLQSLCVRKGFRCNFAKHPNKISIYIEPYKLDRKITFCNDGRDQFKKEEFWKKETVWCVDNNKQTLIIRRNNKVSIVGNCIGRGTRPLTGVIDGLNTASERIAAIKSSKKKRTVIIDVTDNTTRHNIVNAYELDKELHPNDRVFITDEKRQLLLAERLKKITKLDFTRDQDETVSLLKIPRIKINLDSEGMKKEASEKQLFWLQSLGYDVKNDIYTMGMVQSIVGELPASKEKIEFARQNGYDVSSGVITNNQINAIQREIWIKQQKKKKLKK